jgi:hypothetical protein
MHHERSLDSKLTLNRNLRRFFMLPFSFIGSWTYTNPATPVAVNIPMTAKPDWVFVKDTTNWGLATTAASPIYSEWFSSMASGSYLGLGQTSVSAGTVNLYTEQGTSGGFTFINQTMPPTFTKVAVTAVNGTTFVVSTGTTTGINVGDTVRLINITGANQISGSNLYQVTAVSAGTSITLGYAASAVTAGLVVANGTTGYYQKVYPGYFLPNTLPVAYITQAAQAVVYFFRQNPYTPGQLVDFQIPTPYGMTQLSNLTAQSGSGPFTSNPAGAARVLSVTNSSTVSSITIDVNTTGFTAFQFPTSAAFAGGASPAVCMPAGSGVVPLNGSATIPASPPGTNLADAFDNLSQYVMNIGTSAVGVANANMVVMAFKADFVNGITNA